MKISQATGAAMLDALKARFNDGTLVFYSGTQPSDPDTPLSGNAALATFTFSGTAFGSESLSGGFEQATASFANATVTEDASGDASFARAFESDGTTPICDFTVGVSGQDINLTSVTFGAGGSITLTSEILKQPVD